MRSVVIATIISAFAFFFVYAVAEESFSRAKESSNCKKACHPKSWNLIDGRCYCAMPDGWEISK